MKAQHTTQLRIGMPAGSLANPDRGGNLITLLQRAGFKTSGYDSGGPSRFTTVDFLYGWDGRPQEFGSQLAIEELDVAIAGDDWIEERRLELELEYNTPIKLKRVMSLGRGGVRIVGIIENSRPEQNIDEYLQNLIRDRKLLIVVSEMPYIALKWVRTALQRIGKLEEYSRFSVQKYKSPPKIDSGIVIYETWGKTESKIRNGGADFGVEITQSGSALRNYGLKIVEEIITSETSIWINPGILQDQQKKELLQMFLLNLYGCINAENKVLLVFNVETPRSREIEQYLRDNNLFGNEPTKTSGDRYCEYTIQVETDNPDLALARIRYELLTHGAQNLDTVPVHSSIPDMTVIDL
jgi:ATP phosphoribosyltransferase